LGWYITLAGPFRIPPQNPDTPKTQVAGSPLTKLGSGCEQFSRGPTGSILSEPGSDPGLTGLVFARQALHRLSHTSSPQLHVLCLLLSAQLGGIRNIHTLGQPSHHPVQQFQQVCKTSGSKAESLSLRTYQGVC
jgi:hypothetical protein